MANEARNGPQGTSRMLSKGTLSPDVPKALGRKPAADVLIEKTPAPEPNPFLGSGIDMSPSAIGERMARKMGFSTSPILEGQEPEAEELPPVGGTITEDTPPELVQRMMDEEMGGIWDVPSLQEPTKSEEDAELEEYKQKKCDRICSKWKPNGTDARLVKEIISLANSLSSAKHAARLVRETYRISNKSAIELSFFTALLQLRKLLTPMDPTEYKRYEVGAKSWIKVEKTALTKVKVGEETHTERVFVDKMVTVKRKVTKPIYRYIDQKIIEGHNLVLRLRLPRQILRCTAGVILGSALVHAGIWLAGYPPPHRMFIESQRIEFHELMRGYCKTPFDYGPYTGNLGDSLLSEDNAILRAKILCAEDYYRRIH